MTKDEYQKKIAKLFKGWKQKKPDGDINHPSSVFISDGIVNENPEEWYSQECRPLFLLREAYGGEHDWDLTDYVRSVADGKNKNHTWRNVAMWTYGILNTHAGDVLPAFPEYHKEADALSKNATTVPFDDQLLQKIAVVNIKKSNGDPSSSDDDLMKYAKYDAKEIWEEIELIDPTVIISANATAIQDELAKKKGFKIERNHQDWTSRLEINKHKVILIEYWHPANHFPNMMNYYTLTAFYERALRALNK